MAPEKLTILLSGMIAAVPHRGDATWAVLQYLLGLKRLGHDVYFVEPVEEAALLPAGAPLARSANAAYFRQVTADFGLEESSALLLARTQQTVGLPYARLRQLALRTDVLINISGLLSDEALTANIPVRACLDLDSAFTQLGTRRRVSTCSLPGTVVSLPSAKPLVAPIASCRRAGWHGLRHPSL